MAQIELKIGGNAYTVACRDGEEGHLTKIAEIVDKKAVDARQAVGSVSEVRQLLFASLLLADELDEARKGAPAAAPVPSPAPAPQAQSDEHLSLLEDIAARLENLALHLERRG
ncbi:cell division protein ZapA [Chakrabartia godavariana]|nr:cell division protein ZapA [Chakrabartia godavariana]